MGSRTSRFRAIAQYFPALIVASVAAGLLLSLIALPVIAGAGLLARNAASDFEALPSEIELPPLQLQNRILDKDGELIATFFEENRISVPLEKIAPVMRNAVVAIEDSRFYEHGAIDLQGAVRALVTNLGAGEVEQGASSVTQQLVKNILIEQAGGNEAKIAAAKAVDLDRKLQELKYAITLEESYTKDEILEAYLNIAYFGSGTYGVEAAARHYFSTTAADLTLEQAAMLAGIIARPVGWDPTRGDDNYKAATDRRNTVLDRMAELGMIGIQQARDAMAKPIELDVSRTPNGCYSSKVAAPLFCQYVRKILEKDEAFGETAQIRSALLDRGGLTIRTTLDLDAQEAADEAIADRVYPEDDIAAALAMVEPGDGAIRAMAQSKTLGLDGESDDQLDLNLAVDAKYGGGVKGFQPGSAMKPFTAAAAIDEGIRTSHVINAPYFRSSSSLGMERDCDAGKVYPDWEAGGVYNYTRSENGPYDMVEGMAKSVNNYFIGLTDEVGLCDVVTMAKRAGVHAADGGQLAEVYSFTLGANNVSPLTMATAYATFAARGTRCDPYAIVSVTDRDGNELPVPDHECKDVIDPEVADVVTYLLTGVVKNGTGEGAQLDDERPVAGKTGTTNNNIHTWFVGYTPQLATAVAVGYPHSSDYPLRRVTIGPRYYPTVYGASLAAPIFKETMDGALEGVEEKSFKRPKSKYIQAERVRVPDVSGRDPGDAEDDLADRGLKAIFASEPVRSDQPAGTVAYTDPAADTSVNRGSTVTIYISSGRPPVPTDPPTDPPTFPTDPPQDE